jgi:hypothetical protein
LFDVAPDLQFKSVAASGERLLSILLMSHKAELHSALGDSEAIGCQASGIEPAQVLAGGLERVR